MKNIPLKVAGAALLAINSWFAATAANAEIVLLQSQQNGSYVCYHGEYLAARCDRARALPIQILSLGDGSVALRNADGGEYIRAGLTQNTLLGRSGREVGAWERFRMQEWNGATYFHSPQADAFVRAGIGPDTLLGAVSPHMRGWEAFTLVEPGSGGPVAAPQPAATVRPVAFEGVWRLDQLVTAQGGHHPIDGIQPGENRVSIDPNGTIGFSLGCNQVNGVLVQRGQDGIETEGPFVTTRMACRNAAFDLERLLADTLEQGHRFAVRDGGRFVISGRDGSFIQLMRL